MEQPTTEPQDKQAPLPPAEEPEKKSDKPHKRKKLLLIGSGLAIAALLAGGVVVAVTSSGSDNKSKQTGMVRSDPNSDFVGQTDKCEPLNGNQWYRSDSTLTVDPVDPNNVGVFVEKRGFFRSTDGGNTWAYKSKGIKGFKAATNYKDRPCYLEFRSAAVDPTNPKRLLLGALGDFDTIKSTFNQAGGLLESLDAGETWHQLLTDNVNAYVHDIAIDPSDPKTLYYITSSQKGANQEKSLLTKGLAYKTTDGGKTWTELPTGILPNTGAQEIYIDEANPKRLMITTITFNFGANGRTSSNETLGTLVSEDGGATWESRKTLPAGDTAIAASFGSPTNFNNMYASILGDGGSKSYYTTDAAKTFKKSGLPMDVVAYDPADTSGNTLVGYAWQSAPSKTLWKSTNAGATWKSFGTLPAEIKNLQDPKTRVSKMVIDPKNSQNIYMAGSSAYVWKSSDGGTTWKATLTLETTP